MTDRLILGLLGDPAPDPGCDACLDRMGAWADARHRGEDADARYPEVATHLRNCKACREDAAGLIARLDEQET